MQTNDNHEKSYDNKRSFNGGAPTEGETLIPFFVSRDMKESYVNSENMETWHIAGKKIPVAFAPAAIESKPAMLKMFWEDVRNYIASGCDPNFCPGDQPPEIGHGADLSLDKLREDMEDDDSNGFEPASDENVEQNVLLALMVDQLMDETTERSPIHGEILNMLKEDYTNGEIVDALPVGKSQAYSRIKEVQKLAREFFGKELAS